MAINLAIEFQLPVGAVSNLVQYARIDNTSVPVWATVSPNPTTSPSVIATNIPNGQYQIQSTPIYPDGRTCQPTITTTPGCPGLISINAIVQGGVLMINYLAPSGTSAVLINVNYPNGGSYSQVYTNTGNTISIGLPSGVYGNYSVSGQSVCDVGSGFYSSPSATVTVSVNQPDTFQQISNTDTGPGGTRTQIFQTGSSVTPGAIYSLIVYNVYVSVTVAPGDTPSSICIKMANAINGTSAVSWNANGSAPAGGTTGFPPVASATVNQVTVVLNYQNQFGSSVN